LYTGWAMENSANPSLQPHFQIRESDILADLPVGEPNDWQSVLELAEKIRQHSVSTHSPLFMNQLFSGVRPESLLADSVISQTRTTMATQEASPIFTKIERELVRALAQRLNWNTVDGIGVPGGSAGNFMAIHCARQIYYPQSKTEGHGGRKLRIFVSDQSHYSFSKACIVLGLGTEALVKVKTDREGRMIPDELIKAVHHERHQGHCPLMVGATAGTTVFGAFDPIRALSDICREESMWLHVDGAWGGPVIFSQEHRSLLDGIEHADSLTFDAHKLLGATLTSTLFVTRHRQILREANDVTGGDYLFHDDDRLDLGRLSWQCGRRADSFVFWLLWKSYGDQGFDEMIAGLFQRRDEFVARLKGSDRFQLIHTPSFLNVCFKFAEADESGERLVRLREALIHQNLAFINYSENAEHGRFFRMVFANPALTPELIDRLIDELHA